MDHVALPLALHLPYSHWFNTLLYSSYIIYSVLWMIVLHKEKFCKLVIFYSFILLFLIRKEKQQNLLFSYAMNNVKHAARCSSIKNLTTNTLYVLLIKRFICMNSYTGTVVFATFAVDSNMVH